MSGEVCILNTIALLNTMSNNLTYPFHINLLCQGVPCTLAEEGDLLADQVLHPGVPVPAQVPQGVAQELPLFLPRGPWGPIQ